MKEEHLMLDSYRKEDKYCRECGSHLKRKYLKPYYNTKTGEKILQYYLVCTRELSFIEKFFSMTCD